MNDQSSRRVFPWSGIQASRTVDSRSRSGTTSLTPIGRYLSKTALLPRAGTCRGSRPAMTTKPNTACLDGYRLMLMYEQRITSRYAEQTVFQYARNKPKAACTPVSHSTQHWCAGSRKYLMSQRRSAGRLVDSRQP